MSVYFIRVGRYFKIGASEDAERRFQKLHQGGTRYTFPVDASMALEDRELYRVIDGWKSDEHSIHIALDDFAVGLEWFLDEPQVREFILNLPRRLTDRQRRNLPKVERVGGWCEDDYREVQHGRAEREAARYLARRSA